MRSMNFYSVKGPWRRASQLLILQLKKLRLGELRNLPRATELRQDPEERKHRSLTSEFRLILQGMGSGLAIACVL